MTILWCGGEDIDFINVGITSQPNYDSDFARMSLYGLSGGAYSENAFANKTTLKLSFRFNNDTMYASFLICGAISLATFRKGIWVAKNSSSYLSINQYDGTTITELASSSVGMTNGGAYFVDLQITDYGSSASISMYINGSIACSYSGDIGVSGVTALNGVGIGSFGGAWTGVSEIIVSEDDSILGRRLRTFAPNAAGDVNEFDYGTYTDLNETSINDATQIYTASADKKFLANCTGMPPGDWTVKAVKIAARCVDGLGTLGAKLGIKSGGTENFETTPQNCSGYWQTKERLMNVNPVTGVAFTPDEVEAIQVGVESGTV